MSHSAIAGVGVAIVLDDAGSVWLWRSGRIGSMDSRNSIKEGCSQPSG
ncbi:MAG: hypothetical protein LBE08_07250 [Bifidobacteriaceae bacterium]|nr:hypothetical protein [Bifidobacteriaceae bacterium]